MNDVKKRLADKILEALTKGDFYTAPSGEKFLGESVSFLKSAMGGGARHRGMFGGAGFRGLGSLSEFEGLCRELGFKTVRARNSRGQLATVVTL